MKFVLTKHAKSWMAERGISSGLVEGALHKPTAMLYDYKGKQLIKKLYTKNGIKRLLLIVGKAQDDTFKIITIIDTSKIEKYL